MSVQTIRDVLISVLGDKVGHYQARKEWNDKYAIFGETSAATELNADDSSIETVIAGEIFYYTSEEYDSNVNAICEALAREEVSYSIVTIGWEQENRQISYQIHWEVACGAGEIY